MAPVFPQVQTKGSASGTSASHPDPVRAGVRLGLHSARVSSTQTLVSQGCLVLFTVLFVVDFFPTSKDSLLSILSPPTTHSFVPLYTGSPSFPFLLLRQVLLSTRLRGRERAQAMLEAQPLLLIWHVSSSVAQLLKALGSPRTSF